MTNRLVPVGIWLMAWGGLLQAQRVSIDAAVRASDKPYVLASGEATLSVRPDQVTIDVGVVTQGQTAAAAAGLNSKQTDSVMMSLHKILTPNDQLRTTSYSVRPNYQTAKPGASATIDGYTPTNTVEIVLADVAQVGKVIDTSLQAGANNIQKLQFGLKNPQAVRSQALAEAAKQARANAEAIAMGLGVHIVQVLSAEEFTDTGNGVGFAYAKAAAVPVVAVPTDVEAGTVEVNAMVMLKAEVAP